MGVFRGPRSWGAALGLMLALVALAALRVDNGNPGSEGPPSSHSLSTHIVVGELGNAKHSPNPNNERADVIRQVDRTPSNPPRTHSH